MARQTARMYAEDMLGIPRYASQVDIGLASRTIVNYRACFPDDMTQPPNSSTMRRSALPPINASPPKFST